MTDAPPSAAPARRLCAALQKTASGEGGRGGFALIMALGLMSLVVLLALALTALISVEAESSRNQLDSALARQNAFVGLMRGIGALQEAAGSDQRVTATADILQARAPNAPQAGVPNKQWVGVWNSDGVEAATGSLSRQPIWLVSGLNPTPTTSLNPNDARTVVLASTFSDINGRANDAVLVIKQPIAPNVSGNTLSATANAQTPALAGNTGYYAYWIADESVKAKVNVVTTDSAAASTSVSAASALAMKNDIASINASLSTYSTLTSSELDRIARLRELDYFLTKSVNPSITVSDQLQHDLTVDSVGLLTDVRHGGWKLDLTTGFGSDTLFNSFYANSVRNKFLLYDIAEYDYSDRESGRKAQGDAEIAIFKDRGPNMLLLRDYVRFYENIKNGGYVQVETFVEGTSSGDKSQALRALGYTPYHKPRSMETIPAHYAGTIVSLDKQELSPMLSFFRFGMRLRQNTSIGNVKYGYPLQVETKTYFGFLNPYNVELRVIKDGESYTRLNAALDPYIWLVHGSVATDSSGLPVITYTDYYAEGATNMAMTTFKTYSGSIRSENSHQLRINNMRIPPGEVGVYGLNQFNSGASTCSDTFNSSTYSVYPVNKTVKLPTSGTQVKYLAGQLSLSSTASYNISNLKAVRVKNGDTIRIVAASMAPPKDSGYYIDKQDYQALFSHASQDFAFYSRYAPVWSARFRTYQSVSRSEVVMTGGNEIPIGAWQFNLRHTRSDEAPRLLIDNNIRAYAMSALYDDLDEGDDAITSMFEFSSGDNPLGKKPVDTWGYVSTDFDDPPQMTGAAPMRGYWGNDIEASGASQVILFDMPRCPPLSIGAFQHACLGLYQNEPSYVAGNSYAPRRLRDNTTLYAKNRNAIDVFGTDIFVYDISWLVNEGLWDRYFFSGLESTASSALDYVTPGISWQSWKDGTRLSNHMSRPLDYPLPNPRLYLENTTEGQVSEETLFNETDTDLYRAVASYLRVNGPFNVNSTSVTAWKALLMGMNGAALPKLSFGSGGAASLTTETVSGNRTAFPRMSFSAGGDNGASGDSNDFWRGYRTLTESEAENLAEKIVEQVRKRGPFRSMADFVNRRLESGEQGDMGALQAAIDEAGLNHSVNAGLSPAVNDRTTWRNAPSGAKTGDGFNGTVMQGDVLQALAPVLTVRGDTFKVRAYGDVVDASGKVTARAYCEAIVQRMPEYCDGANASYVGTLRQNAEGDMNSMTEANQKLGRRFKIVKLRWLNSDEI